MGKLRFWKKIEIFFEKFQKILKNGKNLRFFASLRRIFQFLSGNLHKKCTKTTKQKVNTQNQNAKKSKRFAYPKPKRFEHL